MTESPIDLLSQVPNVQAATQELTRRIREHSKWIRTIRIQCKDPHKGNALKWLGAARRFPPGGPTLPADAVAAATVKELLEHAAAHPDPSSLFYKVHVQCTGETGESYSTTLNLDLRAALDQGPSHPGPIAMHDSSVLGLSHMGMAGLGGDNDDVDVEEPLMRILDRSLSEAQREKTRLFTFIMEREENYAKAQLSQMQAIQAMFSTTTDMIRTATDMMARTHEKSEKMLEIAAEKEIAQEESRQRARNIEQTIKAVTEQGLPILKMVLAHNLGKKANAAQAHAAQAPATSAKANAAQAPEPQPTELNDPMPSPVSVSVTHTLPEILADLTDDEAAQVERIVGADLLRRLRDPSAWTIAAMSDLSTIMGDQPDLFLELAEVIGPDRVAKVITLYEELTGTDPDDGEGSDNPDDEDNDDGNDEGNADLDDGGNA